MNRKELEAALEKLDFRKLLDTFLDHVPEAAEPLKKIQAETRFDMMSDLFALWDMGIMRYIMELLSNPDVYADELFRAFVFFERMIDENEMYKSMVFGSTLGNIYRTPETINAAVSFMQPKTKRMWDEYQEYEKAFSIWQLSQLQ